MIEPDRAAPNAPGVKACCQIPGNLDWTPRPNDDGTALITNCFVGVCKVCGCKHHVMKVKAINL